MKFKRLLFAGIITSCYLLSGCGTSMSTTTNQDDDSSSSFISNSTSESVDEDSSEEEDYDSETLEEEDLDANKLLKNIKEMATYTFSYSVTNTRKHKASNILEVDKTNNVIKTNGKDYESSGSYEARQIGTLGSFAAYYDRSEDSALSMIKSSGNYQYDQNSQKYTLTRIDKITPYLYQYNDELEQYAQYSIYNGRAVTGNYITYMTGLIPYVVTTDLLEEIAKNGTPNENNNTVTYAVTEEALENEHIGFLLSSTSSPDTITLQVVNNYPHKIVIHPEQSSDNQNTYENIDQVVELIYSNINNTTLIHGDTINPCSHHGKALYAGTDFHAYYCPECGMFISDKEAHNYDEEYGVCKECGSVKGLYSNERTNVVDLGNNYFVGVYEDAKGRYSTPLMFIHKADDKFIYGSALMGGDNLLYDCDAKAAAMCFETTEIPIAGSKCIKLIKYGYHVYKDIPFDDGNSSYVNGQYLEDYLLNESVEPCATIYCYEAKCQHNYHTITTSNNCIQTTTYYCDACGETDYRVNVKHNHTNLSNYERVSSQEFYELFTKTPSSNSTYYSCNETDSYYKAHCANCDKDVYMRAYSDMGEYHNQYANYYTIFEKDEMLTHISDYNNTLPHIKGSDGHCIFCNQYMGQGENISVYVNGSMGFNPTEYPAYSDGNITAWIYDGVYLNSGDRLSIYIDGNLITANTFDNTNINYLERSTTDEFTILKSGICYTTLYLYQGEYYFEVYLGSRYNQGGSGGNSSEASSSSEPAQSSEYSSDEADTSEDEWWYDNCVYVDGMEISLDSYEDNNGRIVYFVDDIYLYEDNTIYFYINGQQQEFYLKYGENEENPVPNCKETSTSSLHDYVTIRDTVDNGYIYLYENENGSYSAYIGPRISQDPGNIHYYDYHYVLYNVSEHRVIAGLEYTSDTDYQGRQQYTATDVELHYGDVIQLYDTTTQIGWITPIDSYSLGSNYSDYIISNDSSSWRVVSSVTLDIYAKFKMNDDQIYLQLTN